MQNEINKAIISMGSSIIRKLDNSHILSKKINRAVWQDVLFGWCKLDLAPRKHIIEASIRAKEMRHLIILISAIDTCDCSAPPASVPFSSALCGFPGSQCIFHTHGSLVPGMCGLVLPRHRAAGIWQHLNSRAYWSVLSHQQFIDPAYQEMQAPCPYPSDAQNQVWLLSHTCKFKVFWRLYTFLLLPFCLSFPIHALKKWCQAHQW